MTSAALYMAKSTLYFSTRGKMQDFCHGNYLRKVKRRVISGMFCLAGNFLATNDGHL